MPSKPPGLDCNSDTETRLKAIPKRPQRVEEPGDRRAQDTQEARAESVARMGGWEPREADRRWVRDAGRRAPSPGCTRITFKYGSLGPGGAFKKPMFSVSLKDLDTQPCRVVVSWATAGLTQQQLSHPGWCLPPCHRTTQAVTFPVSTKHGPLIETEPREGQGHEAA